MNTKILKELLFVSILVLFGVVSRTIWHIGPNVEFVTALSLLAGMAIQTNWIRYIVPIAIMISSDLLIGNSNIFIFTWSAFLIVPLIGTMLNKSKFNKLLSLEVGGIGAVLIFFLWTNLGVVIMSELYPNTMRGLLQSYYNAIPFLVNQLIGNIIFAPIVYVVGVALYKAIDGLNFGISKFGLLKKSV